MEAGGHVQPNSDQPTEDGTPDAADEVEAVAALLDLFALTEERLAAAASLAARLDPVDHRGMLLGVTAAADQRVAALRSLAAAVRALTPGSVR